MSEVRTRKQSVVWDCHTSLRYARNDGNCFVIIVLSAFFRLRSETDLDRVYFLNSSIKKFMHRKKREVVLLCKQIMKV